MFLGELLKSANKKYYKIPVKGICFDSRKVKKNDIFFAINGTQTSGNTFIHDAVLKGASVIISSKNIKYKNNKIPHILVKDTRKSLAEPFKIDSPTKASIVNILSLKTPAPNVSMDACCVKENCFVPSPSIWS